jgi:hypothetical protein
LVIGAPSFPPTSKHSGAHIVPKISEVTRFD